MRLRKSRNDEQRPNNDERPPVAGLRALQMFKDCSTAELELVDSLLCEARVHAGRVLVREGQLADQMLVVVEGRARVSRFGETIGYAEAGACVGGRELYERRPNVLTMTAETSMVLRSATARDMLSLLSVIPRAEFVRPPVVRPAETVAVRVEAVMAPLAIEARCPAGELVAVGVPTSPEAPTDPSTRTGTERRGLRRDRGADPVPAVRWEQP